MKLTSLLSSKNDGENENKPDSLCGSHDCSGIKKKKKLKKDEYDLNVTKIFLICVGSR